MRGVVRACAAGLGSLLLAGCTSSVAGPAPAGDVGTSSAAPESALESPPTVMAAARTPASQLHAYRPTWLTLPSGVVLPVDPAGVGPDGRLEIPDDPARAGW